MPNNPDAPLAPEAARRTSAKRRPSSATPAASGDPVRASATAVRPFEVAPRLFETAPHRVEIAPHRYGMTLHRFERAAGLIRIALHPFKTARHRFEIVPHPSGTARHPFKMAVHLLHKPPGTRQRPNLHSHQKAPRLRPPAHNTADDPPTHPMAAFSSLPLPQLIPAARALYTNARDDAGIAAALSDYGYTAPADFDDGLALTAEAETAIGTQRAEYADQYAATAGANQTAAEVEALYSRHRQLARFAHPSGTDGHSALRLAGSTARDRAGLLQDAGAFYDLLAARPDLAAPIRGLDAEAITEGQARVATAREAQVAQSAEAGEAQRATTLRDDAVARLRAHTAELASVAKLALSDRPQLREKLGLLERS